MEDPLAISSQPVLLKTCTLTVKYPHRTTAKYEKRCVYFNPRFAEYSPQFERFLHETRRVEVDIYVLQGCLSRLACVDFLRTRHSRLSPAYLSELFELREELPWIFKHFRFPALTPRMIHGVTAIYLCLSWPVTR